MGKIETALQMAKEAQAKKVRSRSDRRRPGDGLPVDPAIEEWAGVAKVRLDQECMAKHRITLGLPERGSAEMAYNMLRTRLIRRMRNNSWSSVIVTSPNAGAGKSVTAINLAISVAREQNQTAYLVDLDLREPSLHVYMGVEEPPGGVTAYLTGSAGLDSALVDGGIRRLYFAFNTIAHQHSAELLTSPRMRQFVEELKHHDPNGIVIYDTPPLLAADDALAFLPQVDCLLLIAAQGETKREDLAKSIGLLEETNLLGVVLNKSVDFERENVYY
jgi:protein-tyrosine kinase